MNNGNDNAIENLPARNGYYWQEQNCPICEVPPTRFVGKRGGTAHREHLGIECDIWRCKKCGLVFPNPMPIPERGLGQHYDVDADEYFKAHDQAIRHESAAKLMVHAERMYGRKGKLLDVGVGRGEILLAALETGWECEGVEPSSRFADHAEERTGVKIWREPIEESEISGNEYDVVILAAVLEHLYDPDKVIAKISSVLKPGGLLYLDVPNESGLYFRVGNLYQKLRGRNWCVNLAPTFSPFHLFGFSPRSLRLLLSKHGLDVGEWKVYGGTSLVSSKGNLVGALESAASRAITSLSNIGGMGTYIEAWAVKK